jgi:hypothetical protein
MRGMNRPAAPSPLLAGVLTLLQLLGGCQTAHPMPPTADSNAAYRGAMGSMMAADGPAALAGLRALPRQGLTERQRAVADCILARFDAPMTVRTASDGSSLPSAAAAVLETYRHYWTEMLMRRVNVGQAEQALRDALGRQTGLDSPSLEEQTEAARLLVERQGLRALGGVTSPLHELMVWRKQAAHTTTVALPEESINVSVFLLDDFVSFGWLGYATCDHHHTGGWATPEGLMVVSPSWDLSSEEYRVSLLAHEAQHFADYRRYPKLEGTDLEYRAKLVELILAGSLCSTGAPRPIKSPRLRKPLGYHPAARTALHGQPCDRASISASRCCAYPVAPTHSITGRSWRSCSSDHASVAGSWCGQRALDDRRCNPEVLHGLRWGGWGAAGGRHPVSAAHTCWTQLSLRVVCWRSPSWAE